MANPRKGVRLPLSPARQMIVELMHHARPVPSLPLACKLDVAELAAARESAVPRPSWTAIFLRAYALVSRRNPPLRRALIRYPRPHLYEHPHSVAGILVERVWRGEPVVLGARITAPENRPLALITDVLTRFAEAPVEDVNYFRQWLRIGRLPAVLRRFLFWSTLHVSGFKRAKRLGTFTLSSLGNFGIEQMHPLTPLTSYFTFGPISPTGEVTAKIVYDHHVLDGRCVARCLRDLEQVLHTDLLAELRVLRPERGTARRTHEFTSANPKRSR
jgi:hypothetical protein